MTRKVIAILLMLSLCATLCVGCKDKKKEDSSVQYYQRPESYSQQPIGLDGYLSLDQMAFIDIENFPYGVSSAGRSNVNSDGFDGQNWLYIDENGDHVICEAKGAGIINRIWTTGTYNEQAIVKIYIDDDKEPVYSDYYYNFTKGTVQPFLYQIGRAHV